MQLLHISSLHVSAVDFQQLVFVFLAVQDFLLWWDEASCIGLNTLYGGYFMGVVLFPCWVHFGAFVAYKLAAISTETSCR